MAHPHRSPAGWSRFPLLILRSVLLAGLFLLFISDRNPVVEEIPQTGETLVPQVSVTDQLFEDGTVLAQATMPDPGWLVIRNLNEDGDGEIVGYSPLAGGANRDVRVEVNPVRAASRLTAVLHLDHPPLGVFGYPSSDPPLAVDGAAVRQEFQLIDAQFDPEAGGEPGVFAIRMDGETYDPQRASIPAGATVIWRNMSEQVYTVIAEDHQFVSAELRPGEEFEYRFDQPGRYPYFCELHGGPGGRGMSGVILVR